MEFKIIKKTPLFAAFSDLGKRIYLPDGIFYWADRAKREAELIVTIGSAFGYEQDFIEDGSDEWVPCYLDILREYSKLDINVLVPYSKISGLNELRNIWKNWIIEKSLFNKSMEKEKLEKLEKYITTPINTSGLTNGIFLSSALFLNPGEFIISPNKRWGNYDNIIEKYLAAKIKSFQFFANGRINTKGLIDVINEISEIQNKIIIILNFPNNPTGYIPSLEEAKELFNVLRDSQKSLEKPFVIIVDDAYEPYKFTDNVIKHSIFYDLQQLDENIIPVKIDGITKELLMYGGRIGFLTIGLKSGWVKNEEELNILKDEIDNKLSGLIRSTISNCNHFYQAITIKLFKDLGIDDLIQKREKIYNLLKLRYEKLNSALKEIKNPNISIDPNSGGFFLFINLNPNKIGALQFADHLLKKYKVGVIPIENTKENINGIRIAFCSIHAKKIPDLVKKIELALNDF